MARAHCALVLALFLATSTVEAVNIQLVTVGNPGNPGELSGGTAGPGPARITGEVDYPYQIGTRAVTVSDYVDFLNAVGTNDTYGLYNSAMELGPFGCGIIRRGGGPWIYTGSGNQPVNYVSFYDAQRFVNWLENGQPNGAQGLGTTESGTYTIGDWHRNPNAHWVIPTEDEWYKAAFQKNDGPTDHYWDYVGQSDFPDNLNGHSAYGTFGQGGGGVDEWNESHFSVFVDEFQGIRGGSSAFHEDLALLSAGSRIFNDLGHYPFPDAEGYELGFRVAYVPEPASITLLCLFVISFTRTIRRKNPRLTPPSWPSRPAPLTS